MKKIVKSILCLSLITILCLGVLCACDNKNDQEKNQKDEFDNIYHATLYDRAIDWLIKDETHQGTTWTNYKDTILITDQEALDANFAEFPVEVDFENQMVCGHLATLTTNGFDYEIKNTSVIDGKMQIDIVTIIPYPHAPGDPFVPSASAPILRCFVVVMDKVEADGVVFNR